MGESPETLDDLGPLVREKTLDLKLKLLDRSISLKIVAAIVATQVVPHLSIPASVTAGVLLGAAYKAVTVVIFR